MRYDQLEDYPWSEVGKDSVVIIVSFYGREETASLLYNKGIAAVSLYDSLAEKGLLLEGNYYDILGQEYYTYHGRNATFDYAPIDMNAIFFYGRRNYEMVQRKSAKEMYLAKMIFDCIYVKDWGAVNKYVEEYVAFL